MNKWGLYQWSIILFFVVVPLLAIAGEILIFRSEEELASIAFKWFVFSGVGLRLGSAGIKQIIQPEFTAREVFGIEDEKAFVVVRELGFANICFSVIGLLSLFFISFRISAAICGGLYFGFAGVYHVLRKPKGEEERFALITDISICVLLGVLLIINV